MNELDEMIKSIKYNLQNTHVANKEYYEQLLEWLLELKAYHRMYGELHKEIHKEVS